MNGKICIALVAFVVLAACQVQAVGKTSRSSGDDSSDDYNYLDASGPIPMPSYENVAPAGPVVQDEIAQQTGGQTRVGIGAHLRDLGATGFQSTKRVYKDVQPKMKELRGDLSGMVQRIKDNRHVAKIAEKARPIASKGSQKLGAISTAAGQKFGAISSATNQRINNFNARHRQQSPGGKAQWSVGANDETDSDYSVPPPVAHHSDELD